MGVELSQSAAAAFHAGTGLLIAMSEGNDGSYLELDLDAETQPLFVRFALRKGSVTLDPPPDGVDWSNGMIVMAGLDAAGETAWRLDYDFDADELTFSDGAEHAPLFTVDWPSGWHVGGMLLEAGQVSLWRDDVSQAVEAGSFGALTTRRVLMGGMMKATSIVGELHLDWLTFAESQLGNPLYYRLVGLRSSR